MLQLKFQFTKGEIVVKTLKFVDKRFKSLLIPSQDVADLLNNSNISIKDEPNDKLF